MLGWSATELAKASSVGPATVRRYEMQSGVPSGNASTLLCIRRAFEDMGVEFTDDSEVNPGVTLHIRQT